MRTMGRDGGLASRARACATAAACTASLAMLAACGGGGSDGGTATTTAATTASDTSSTTAASTAATDAAATTATTATTSGSGTSSTGTASSGTTSTGSSGTGTTSTGSTTGTSSTGTSSTGTSSGSTTTSTTSSTSSTSSGTIDPTNLAGTAHLTFDDEFTSLSLWNGSSGTWDTTFYYDDNNKGSTLSGNSEQEMYINANYAATSSVKPWTVSDGILTLQAAKASSTIATALGGYQYTSGMINTYHSFAQQYGYFEMRAQLPAGQGLWPAFWLMPTDGSWPPELDIMEVLGNDMTKLYTTVHTNETGSHTMSSQGNTVADMSSGYHTYGVDWEADTITFYFDGKQVYQVATPSDMKKPMYVIANLAVGGSWPGNVDSTTPLPANMNIDYIRVYAAGT